MAFGISHENEMDLNRPQPGRVKGFGYSPRAKGNRLSKLVFPLALDKKIRHMWWH